MVPRNTVRTAEYKHRQNHKYSSATDACWFTHRWCIKPWMWVLQSHDYLSSALLMAAAVYGMVMYRSGGIAPLILTLGAEVSQCQPHAPQFQPRGQSPQLLFARWL